jgi:hypothetical protein
MTSVYKDISKKHMILTSKCQALGKEANRRGRDIKID